MTRLRSVKPRKGGRRAVRTAEERQALDLCGRAIEAELTGNGGNGKGLPIGPEISGMERFGGKDRPPPETPPAPPFSVGRGFRLPGSTTLGIDTIRPSRWPLRARIDDAALTALAGSIQAQGVLEPVIVRAIKPEGPGAQVGYELVAGERRWRAARIAGLAAVPAIVRELDDRQAREMAALENLQREDLTPIEEARAYTTLLAGPDAPTQEQFGKRLGISQPQIAARLALLKLPEKWQKRVGSGEIPPTHARLLMPFRERPQILKSIEERIEYDEGVGSLADFGDRVHSASREHTRRISGDGPYEWKIRKNVPRFTPTPEERKALDIIEILDDGDGDGTVEVACNVKLWNKLQKKFADQFVKQELAKQKKKGEGGRGKAEGGRRKAENTDKPPTAAELKAQAEIDRRRAKEAAERTAKGVADWRTDWLRKLIAERFGEGLAATDRERLLLYFAASDRFPGGIYTASIRRERHESLAKILRAVGGRGDLWPAIAAKGDVDCVVSWLQARFWDAKDKGPVDEVPAQDVERIADELGVDPAKAWPGDQKTAIGEAYWNLHTKEQLLDLGKELGVHFSGAEKKEEMTRRLMTAAAPLAMPRELRGKGEGGRRKR